MINITRAAERAASEAALRRLIKRNLGRRSEKAAVKLETLLSEKETEGVYIVFGDTYKNKEEIKAAGFRFCAGHWFSEEKIELNIDGLTVIEA